MEIFLKKLFCQAWYAQMKPFLLFFARGLLFQSNPYAGFMAHLHLAEMQACPVLLRPVVNHGSSPTSGLRTWANSPPPPSLCVKCDWGSAVSSPLCFCRGRAPVLSVGRKDFECFACEDKRQREIPFWDSFQISLALLNGLIFRHS